MYVKQVEWRETKDGMQESNLKQKIVVTEEERGSQTYAYRSEVEVEVIDNSEQRDAHVPALLEKRGSTAESDGRGDGEGVRDPKTSNSSDGC